MLDFSKKRELTLHARLVADVLHAAEPLGVEVMIVGAIARDLHEGGKTAE